MLHLETHKSTKPYLCNKCGMVFATKIELNNHDSEHDENLERSLTHEGQTGKEIPPDLSSFSCAQCDTEFADYQNLKKHQKIHNGDNLYSCSVCGKSFTTNGYLKTHMTIHTGEKPYRCEICGKAKRTKLLLRNHKRVHTKEGNSPNDKVSQSNNLLANSLKETPNVLSFSCNYCDKQFNQKQDLENHKKVHKTNKSIQVQPLESEIATRSITVSMVGAKEQIKLQDVTTKDNEVDNSEDNLNKKIFPCQHCDKIFTHRGSVWAHTQRRHLGKGNKEKNISCEHCDKKFSMNYMLKEHLRIHTGEKPFSCDICKKAFTTMSGLYIHKKIHSDVKPYSCKYCGKRFIQKGQLDTHIRVHLGVKPYSCEFCDHAVSDRSAFTRHKRSHQGDKPYLCRICQAIFATRDDLNIHKNEEHPNVLDQKIPILEPLEANILPDTVSMNSISPEQKPVTTILPETMTSTSITTEIVNSVMSHEQLIDTNIDLLSNSVDNETNDDQIIKEPVGYISADRTAQNKTKRIYPCQQCDKTYTSRRCVLAHTQRCHLGKVKEKNIPCEYCDKKFSMNYLLKEHLRIHTGEKPFSCDICNKAFSQLSSLRIHKKVHAGVKPYSCEYCSKSFVHKCQLVTHTRIHLGVKPYSCDKCGNTFSDRSAKIQHEKKCGFGDNLRCRICDKIFNFQGLLDRHFTICQDKFNKKASEEVEKPKPSTIQNNSESFSCNFCDKYFKSNEKLKKHIYIAHSEKKFKCEYCFKDFLLESMLDNHIRSHTGEKPFSCNLCNKAYPAKHNLMRHIKFKHNEVSDKQ